MATTATSLTHPALGPAVRPPSDAVRVVLSDGREATIRTLDARDGDALVAAVARADPWDLRKRFMGTPPPARVLVRGLSAADGVHDRVIGAFDDIGRLVGVAQFDRIGERHDAEIAVEVDTEWQHHGLGTALVRRLAEIARGVGIDRFTATFYADNIAIRRLLHDIGGVMTTTYASGAGDASIEIGDATNVGRVARRTALRTPPAARRVRMRA